MEPPESAVFTIDMKCSMGKEGPGSQWFDFFQAALTFACDVMPLAPARRSAAESKRAGMPYLAHQSATLRAAHARVFCLAIHWLTLQFANPTIST